jgi:hypothetical protein
MRRNPDGALISVKQVSEISGACYRSVCRETFVPSMARDCFLAPTADPDGEYLLICERCLDAQYLAEGTVVVNVSSTGEVSIVAPPPAKKTRRWPFGRWLFGRRDSTPAQQSAENTMRREAEPLPIEPSEPSLLKKSLATYRARPSDDPARSLIEAAGRLSANQGSLEAERATVRRSSGLSQAVVAEIFAIADSAAGSSDPDYRLLMEVAQAAAVSSASLDVRTLASARLALAAKDGGDFDRAVTFYGDAMEGVELLDRFFGAPNDARNRLRAMIDRGAEEARHRAGTAQQPNDGVSDRAAQWIDAIAWNSDLGGTQGILSQVDATQRLGIRFIDHLRQDHPLAPPVEEMMGTIQAMSKTDSWLAARCAVTVGDALMEAAEYELAAKVHRELIQRTGIDATSPIAIHSHVQAAVCSIRSGATDLAGTDLANVDEDYLQSMSDIVLTVAAERARFEAAKAAHRAPLGLESDGVSEGRARELVSSVSILAQAEPEDRVTYLRALFWLVLRRDVDSLLAGAS